MLLALKEIASSSAFSNGGGWGGFSDESSRNFPFPDARGKRPGPW